VGGPHPAAAGARGARRLHAGAGPLPVQSEHIKAELPPCLRRGTVHASEMCVGSTVFANGQSDLLVLAFICSSADLCEPMVMTLPRRGCCCMTGKGASPTAGTWTQTSPWRASRSPSSTVRRLPAASGSTQACAEQLDASSSCIVTPYTVASMKPIFRCVTKGDIAGQQTAMLWEAAACSASSPACRDSGCDCRSTGLTLAAYCGDRVLTEQTDEQTDRLIFYGEPTPETVGPLDDLICKQVLVSLRARPLAFLVSIRPLLASRGANTTWWLALLFSSTLHRRMRPSQPPCSVRRSHARSSSWWAARRASTRCGRRSRIGWAATRTSPPRCQACWRCSSHVLLCCMPNA